MAIIFADSACVLCDEPLDRPYTATSGAAFPEDHPLWRYCDAPIHLDCLERWPAREEFSHGYYQMAREWFRQIETLLVENDMWLLGCGPTRYSPVPAEVGILLKNKRPAFAEVRLADWPFRLYSGWNEWDTFVMGGYRNALSGTALVAAERVMGDVRLHAPNVVALERLWRETSLPKPQSST